MDPRRVELARAFLQEAVFRARDAGARAQAAGGITGGITGAVGNCGLGESPHFVDELSPRAAEILAQLWGSAPGAALSAEIRARTHAWVAAQDRLDRDRNHFLKAFRQRHGSERSRYAPAERTAFDAGLEHVNGAANRALDEAAAALAAL